MLLPKQHIYEAEISLDQQAAEACPTLAAWDRDSSMRTMLSVLWPQQHGAVAFPSQATKAQVNTGAAPGTAIALFTALPAALFRLPGFGLPAMAQMQIGVLGVQAALACTSLADTPDDHGKVIASCSSICESSCPAPCVKQG